MSYAPMTPALAQSLSKAAEASGRVLHESLRACKGGEVLGVFDASGMAWRPDCDDGDGARLEAELGIQVSWGSHRVVCTAQNSQHISLGYYAEHGGSRQSARRAAVLEIATRLPPKKEGTNAE
jgi:hypothetical protein